MTGYPMPVRLLAAWLVLVTTVPAVLGIGAKLELVESAMATASIGIAVLAALAGLAVFERPSGSFKDWLRRLETRLLSPMQQSTSSNTKEQSND
jgi:hypothetical protein